MIWLITVAGWTEKEILYMFKLERKFVETWSKRDDPDNQAGQDQVVMISCLGKAALLITFTPFLRARNAIASAEWGRGPRSYYH